MGKPVLRGFFYTATREEVADHLSDGSKLLLHKLQEKGFPGIFEVRPDGTPLIKAWTVSELHTVAMMDMRQSRNIIPFRGRDNRRLLTDPGQEMLIGEAAGDPSGPSEWRNSKIIIMPNPKHGRGTGWSTSSFIDRTIIGDTALVFMLIPNGPVEFPEEYHCDRLVFFMANLAEWLRGSARNFFTDSNTGEMDWKKYHESGEVNYKRPESIQVELDKGPRMRIEFGTRLDFDRLEQRTWVVLEYDKPRPLSSAMEDMKKVQRFFQFAMNHASPVLECRIYTREICNGGTDVFCYSPHDLYESHSGRFESASMLFDMRELQKAGMDLKESLDKWWSFYDEFEPESLICFYDLIFDERPKYLVAAFNTLTPMLERVWNKWLARESKKKYGPEWNNLSKDLGKKYRGNKFGLKYYSITQETMRAVNYSPSDDSLVKFVCATIDARNSSLHGRLDNDLASIRRIYPFMQWLLRLHMLDRIGASAFGPHILQASNLYSLQRDMKLAGFPAEEQPKASKTFTT